MAVLPPEPLGPRSSPSLADRLERVEQRLDRLELLRYAVCAVFVAFTAVTGACGLNLFSYVDEQVKQHIPQLIQDRADKAAQQLFDKALPNEVAPQIKREVQQQFERQRPELERQIERHVAGALPHELRLGWCVQRLGGNFTAGSGQFIERIDLSDTRVTDADLARLTQEFGVERVKSLVLRNTSVTGAGLTVLGRWHELEEMDLAGTAINAEDALPPFARFDSPEVRLSERSDKLGPRSDSSSIRERKRPG